MPELEKQIAEWRQEMTHAGIRKPEVLDELEAHLREQVAHLQGIGLSEAEQFQIAIGRMGEIQSIKKEFSKVNRFHFQLPQNNPVELNILGICFILWGLHAIISMTRIIFLGSHDWGWANGTNSFTAGIAAMITMLLAAGLHCVSGIGLIRCRNFWRYCALALAVVQAFSSIYGLVTRVFGPAANYSSGHYTAWMGVMVPMRYQWIAELFTLLIMAWACVYLSKPEVRNLFRAGAKIKTA